MRKAKAVNSLHRAGFLSAVLLCLSASVALGEVTPIGPDDFGPDAVVEQFEGIVGVQVPADPFWVIWGDLPVPFDFGSGVSLTAVTDLAQAGDFSLQPDPPEGVIYGWGLGLEGGNLDYLVEIPSPTGVLAVSPSGPIRFTFDEPVLQVGFYAEASIFVDVGEEGSIFLEVFGLDDVSLGSREVFADGCGIRLSDGVDLGPLDTWCGVESTVPIGSIEITGTVLVMDDLTFGSGVVSVENKSWSGVKNLYR